MRVEYKEWKDEEMGSENEVIRGLLMECSEKVELYVKEKVLKYGFEEVIELLRKREAEIKETIEHLRKEELETENKKLREELKNAEEKLKEMENIVRTKDEIIKDLGEKHRKKCMNCGRISHGERECWEKDVINLCR